jgi:cyanate permease
LNTTDNKKLMYFGANVSFASLPVYLPTILAKIGYSSIHAQGLSAPPYFVAFLFALITTYVADKTQQRGLMIVATSIVGGIGYVILATVVTAGVRYFAVFLAAAGVFSTIPNILAWTLSMRPPS